jgi:hypothetical protein
VKQNEPINPYEPIAKPSDDPIVAKRNSWIQLQASRNLFQLVIIIVFAAIGAFIGRRLVEDDFDIAGLAGGFVGVVAGTLLSGLCLMIFPPTKRIETNPLDED